MGGLILFCAALFFVVFISLFLKKVVVRDRANRKVRLNLSGVKGSVVFSELLWALIGTVILLYCLSLLVPLVWMLYSSFKDEVDFAYNAFSLPKKQFGWHFENYAIILQKLKVTSDNGYVYGLWDMFLNSAVYSLITPLVSVFWMTVVAYTMSRFDFFGNKLLYTLGILIMMIPITGSIASQMIIWKNWGLYDNMYFNIFLPPSVAFSGIHFMILYGALRAIPKTYGEAAYIDGANEWCVMFRVIIPMVIPTCATLFMLQFITQWNNYETFLVWYPSSPNLAYGMYKFQYSATSGNEGAATTPQILAGFTVTMIPSMIIYISGQKLMKSKFTVGGLKG